MPYQTDTSPFLQTMAPCGPVFAGFGSIAPIVSAAIAGATTIATTWFTIDQANRDQKQARHDIQRETARQAELAAAQAKMYADAQRTAQVQTALAAQAPSTTPGILAGGRQVAAALGSPIGLVALLAVGGGLLLLLRAR